MGIVWKAPVVRRSNRQRPRRSRRLGRRRREARRNDRRRPYLGGLGGFSEIWIASNKANQKAVPERERGEVLAFVESAKKDIVE